MIIRPLVVEDRPLYNQAVTHPLQSWEWGEFRRATGAAVERLGLFRDSGELDSAVQMTFHPIPVLGGSAGYIPKGIQPTPALFPSLRTVAEKHGAVFVKMEPNVQFPAGSSEYYKDLDMMLRQNGCRPGQSLFTQYSFVLDLQADEETLLANCKSKTRYNIRLAQKKGVEVVEDTTEHGLQAYLRLLEETTERQNFYAHNRSYFETMWSVLKDTPMMRIMTAVYEGKVITAWILFFFNGVAYYPYGASSREHKDVMANNLVMWEAIKLAKKQGCTQFDMWGALGPEPDEKHKWYGFHRFKEGYGATLMQSIGTYDFVMQPFQYSLFQVGNQLRWTWLRLRNR